MTEDAPTSARDRAAMEARVRGSNARKEIAELRQEHLNAQKPLPTVCRIGDSAAYEGATMLTGRRFLGMELVYDPTVKGITVE